MKEVSTAWGDAKPNEVRASWKKLEKAIEHVVEFLTGTVKWRRLSALPSINTLIPLIYTVAVTGKFELDDRNRRAAGYISSPFITTLAARQTLPSTA